MQAHLQVRDDHGNPLPLSRFLGEHFLSMIEDRAGASSKVLAHDILENYRKLVEEAMEDMERGVRVRLDSGRLADPTSRETLQRELQNVVEVREYIEETLDRTVPT